MKERNKIIIFWNSSKTEKYRKKFIACKLQNA